MIGSIFSKLEKKRADFEKTIISMNREHEDSEDDDGPNSQTPEWNSRDDDYDVTKNFAGERNMPWLKAPLHSLEKSAVEDEHQGGDEMGEGEIALAALSPLLKRAGLAHLLQTLVARGCRTPEQLLRAAIRGDDALEELGLKKAHILKLHRVLEEEEFTTREVGVQSVNTEEDNDNADLSDEVSAESGLSSASLSSSPSSSLAPSSSEEEEDEGDAEVAADDAARRAEWQRTMATEKAIDDEMVNMVLRTMDEDRVRKEAKRAWRAQQAFNKAKKKAEADAKRARQQKNNSPGRVTGVSEATKDRAPQRSRLAAPHLTPTTRSRSAVDENSRKSMQRHRTSMLGMSLSRASIAAAVAAVLVGMIAMVLSQGLSWHFLTSPRGPYGAPSFSEHIPLDTWGIEPANSASSAVEDWDELPEPGVASPSFSPNGLIELAQRAANSRFSGIGLENSDGVQKLLNFWAGAAETDEHGKKRDSTKAAGTESTNSGAFKWASSAAALALSKLRHRAITVAGLKIHFVHELANIPDPTPEQQQRYEAKMRRHRRRGNVYAQAGDENNEDATSPPSGHPSVTKRTLLLVHEWPFGSVLDFAHVIPILTQPQCLYGPREPPPKKEGFNADAGQDEDVPSCMAFDVVAPSLPGFGWSDAVATKNKNSFDALAAGRILLTLMEQLNITEYWIHGGKSGGVIGAGMVQLAHADASHLRAFNPLYKPAVVGLHLTQFPTSPFALGVAAAPLLSTFGVLGGPYFCERIAAAQVKRGCNPDNEDDIGGEDNSKETHGNRHWGNGISGKLLGWAMGEYNNSVSRTGGVGAALSGSGEEWVLDEKERWCSVFTERSKEAHLNSLNVDQFQASSEKSRDCRIEPSDSTGSITTSGSSSSSKHLSWLSWCAALALFLQEKNNMDRHWSTEHSLPGLNALTLALDDSPLALATFHLEMAVASISRQQCPSDSKEQGGSASAKVGKSEYENDNAGACRKNLLDEENERSWRVLTALKEEGQPGSDWLAANLHVAWFHPSGVSPPLQLHQNSFGNPGSRTWRSLEAVVPGPIAVSDFPGDQHRWPAPLLALRFPNLARLARQEATSGRNSRFAALDQPRDFAAEVARSVEAMVEVQIAAEAAARKAAEVAAAASTNTTTTKSARSMKSSSSSKSTKTKPSQATDIKKSASSSSSGGRIPPANVGKYRAAGSRDGTTPRAAHGNVEWGPPDLSTKTAKYPAGTLMYDPDLHGSKRPKDGVFRPKETWKPLDVFSRK